ncbi:MAG TPA: hypothetical protein VEP89_04190 [Draconibacterium sp.]|nr:hypothetical protein [Draconibacterium sp.]
MEKKRRGLQVYAIIVSIVAIVTFIICLSIMVAAIINRSDPMNSGYSRDDLSSFESYKLEKMKSISKDQAYVPNDEELKAMFDAAKTDKINRVMHNTKRDMIISSLLIVLSIVLFVIHWTIIKRYNQLES